MPAPRRLFDLAALPAGRAAARAAGLAYYRCAPCARCGTEVKHVKYGCYVCYHDYQVRRTRRRAVERARLAPGFIAPPAPREDHSAWIPSAPSPGSCRAFNPRQEGSTPSGRAPFS